MNKSTPRVNLDEQADQVLQEMLGELRQSHEFVKIKPAGLVSWLVRWFHRNAFAKQKEKIAKQHFNRKDYLKKALSDAQTDGDVEQILKTALGTAKTKLRHKKALKGQNGLN